MDTLPQDLQAALPSTVAKPLAEYTEEDVKSCLQRMQTQRARRQPTGNSRGGATRLADEPDACRARRLAHQASVHQKIQLADLQSPEMIQARDLVATTFPSSSALPNNDTDPRIAIGAEKYDRRQCRPGCFMPSDEDAFAKGGSEVRARWGQLLARLQEADELSQAQSRLKGAADPPKRVTPGDMREAVDAIAREAWWLPTRALVDEHLRGVGYDVDAARRELRAGRVLGRWHNLPGY